MQGTIRRGRENAPLSASKLKRYLAAMPALRLMYLAGLSSEELKADLEELCKKVSFTEQREVQMKIGALEVRTRQVVDGS